MASLSGRLKRIEVLIGAAKADEGQSARQVLRQLAATIFDAAPDDRATLELTSALFKTLAQSWPEIDPMECYLGPEERAALVTWQERCARERWPVLAAANDEDRRTTALFLHDWHFHHAGAMEWQRRGILEAGTPEYGLYMETAERGYQFWQWGGWTMRGLPADYTDDPRPVPETRRQIAAALLDLATGGQA